MAETASGADRDDDRCIEAWRLTITQSDMILSRCLMFQCFCSYKVHDFYTTFQMPSGGGH
jgi:hypothetical protein